MIRHHPTLTLPDTLVPYTPLVRSRRREPGSQGIRGLPGPGRSGRTGAVALCRRGAGTHRGVAGEPRRYRGGRRRTGARTEAAAGRASRTLDGHAGRVSPERLHSLGPTITASAATGRGATRDTASPGWRHRHRGRRRDGTTRSKTSGG